MATRGVDKTWGFKVAQAIVDRGKKEKGAGMTQDEIIEIAREAGLYQDINVSFHQALKNFYDLATAKERKATIKIIKETPFSNWFQADLVEAIRARGEA